MYIVFEGIDGSGKSTQAGLLLAKIGLPLDFVVPEPRGVAGGVTEAIAGLLRNKNERKNSLTEAFLFSAARSEIMQNIVIPKLGRDGLVIGDRSIISTFAYQLARGAKKESLYHLYSIYLAEKWPVPDLVVFLDLDYDTFVERMSQKPERKIDSFEGAEKRIIEDTIENYRVLCQGKFLADNWLVLDGRESVEKIHQIICEKVFSMVDYNK